MTHSSSAVLVYPGSQVPPTASRLDGMTPSLIRKLHNKAAALRAKYPEREQIALHLGESDVGTPRFIVDAAANALQEGALFYEDNQGRKELLLALAEDYQKRLGIDLDYRSFLITSGGMQAIFITMLGLLMPGDGVIVVTPSWPNLKESAKATGGVVHELALRFDTASKCFKFHFDDLEQLAAQMTGLRMLVLNTPSNPTGYVMPEADMRKLLHFCRENDVILMADEMYHRMQFITPPAPSFLSLREKHDQLVVIGGFSKTYAMTGWRLGYLVANPTLVTRLSQMQEFVVSCVSSSTQVAAITALRDGESYVTQALEDLKMQHQIAVSYLQKIPEIEIASPDSTFYAFFRLPTVKDSMAYCEKLLEETGVIVAPGAAFGEGGEGWLRICFAKQPALLKKALQKLVEFCCKDNH